MDHVYRTYQIQTSGQPNPDRTCWIPKALIFGSRRSGEHGQPLTGPDNVFKTEGAAAHYALQMAKWWIDDEMRVEAVAPKLERRTKPRGMVGRSRG